MNQWMHMFKLNSSIHIAFVVVPCYFNASNGHQWSLPSGPQHRTETNLMSTLQVCKTGLWNMYIRWILFRAPHSCHGEQAFVTLDLSVKSCPVGPSGLCTCTQFHPLSHKKWPWQLVFHSAQRPKCNPAPLSSSTQLLLAKLHYSKIAAVHCSFKKKTTTTTEDPQSKK
jgi:hypothetical protein